MRRLLFPSRSFNRFSSSCTSPSLGFSPCTGRGVAVTLVVFIAFLFPMAASAMQQTMWDFTQPVIPGSWQVNSSFQVHARPGEGLQIRATEDGGMLQTQMPDHGIDSVSFTVSAQQPVTAALLWHRAGESEKAIYQIPFTIPAGDHQVVGISAEYFDTWSRTPDRLGLGLPRGADVELHSIALVGLNPFEKFMEACTSFWDIDQFTSYTINFLWGPLTTFTPVGRASLYQYSPPRAQSANRYFFFLFALALMVILYYRWKYGEDADPDASTLRKRSPHLFAICAVFATLWLFYDLRMGVEYFVYAARDQIHYIGKKPGDPTRAFRNFQNFYDIADSAAPLLQERGQTYGMLLPGAGPFDGIMRYRTYPVDGIRVVEGSQIGNIHDWLVFRRDDVTVNDKGQLTVGSQVITGSGKILQRYDDSSFLFTTAP